MRQLKIKDFKWGVDDLRQTGMSKKRNHYYYAQSNTIFWLYYQEDAKQLGMNTTKFWEAERMFVSKGSKDGLEKPPLTILRGKIAELSKFTNGDHQGTM